MTSAELKKTVSSVTTGITMQLMNYDWEDLAEVMDEIARWATEQAEITRYREPIDGDDNDDD